MLSYQISGFFNHQCLWKQQINTSQSETSWDLLEVFLDYLRGTARVNTSQNEWVFFKFINQVSSYRWRSAHSIRLHQYLQKELIDLLDFKHRNDRNGTFGMINLRLRDAFSWVRPTSSSHTQISWYFLKVSWNYDRGSRVSPTGGMGGFPLHQPKICSPPVRFPIPHPPPLTVIWKTLWSEIKIREFHIFYTQKT